MWSFSNDWNLEISKGSSVEKSHHPVPKEKGQILILDDGCFQFLSEMGSSTIVAAVTIATVGVN